MNTLNVMFFTGRTEFNQEIGQALEGTLKGFAVDVVQTSEEADIVVCTPDFIRTFQDNIVMVLSDSSEFLDENDCVVEYTPFPITDDDLERLNWRLISIAQNMRLGGD